MSQISYIAGGIIVIVFSYILFWLWLNTLPKKDKKNKKKQKSAARDRRAE